MDGRLNRRNRAAFSNPSDAVWTGRQVHVGQSVRRNLIVIIQKNGARFSVVGVLSQTGNFKY